MVRSISALAYGVGRLSHPTYQPKVRQRYTPMIEFRQGANIINHNPLIELWEAGELLGVINSHEGWISLTTKMTLEQNVSRLNVMKDQKTGEITFVTQLGLWFKRFRGTVPA